MKYLNILLFFIIFAASSAHASDIYVLLSDNSEEYQRLGLDLHSTLKKEIDEASIHLLQLSELEVDTLQPKALVITIGNKAALDISQEKLINPVIYGFSNTQVLPSKGNWVAPVITQPLTRMSQIVDPLLKDQFKTRMLIAYSDTNTAVHSEVQTLPKLPNAEFDIVQIPAEEKPAKFIEDKLFNAGMIIAVSDQSVWSGENARWMLYQAYRYKVPVIGYSKSFLKAGALASVYSTLDQISQTIVEQAVSFFAKGKLSRQGILYSDYNIEYNKNIARALKINVPADQMGVESQQ